MPEGDTIWRTARTLDAALASRVVRRFSSPLPPVSVAAERLAVVGDTIDGVEARGKHLLIRFGGGAVLHTHQGMRGGWHLRRAETPPPRRPARPRVLIEAGGVVATCSRAPVVELLSAREAAQHPALVRLGPDILGPGFDRGAAVARLRARGDLEIGVAVMDQTVLAGIGNVYKSETLFLTRVSPRDRVGALGDETLERIVATARDLMRRNLGTGPRRTTSSLARERLWVYGRGGRPCRRCGTAIRRVVQGEQVRSTWFCPCCQAPSTPEP